MKVVDDRTPDQKDTHTHIIGGTDKCMSGWGEAKGGTSYAGWACTPDDAPKVERWVHARGDMSRVRLMVRTWRPRGKGHCHIYVVTDGHPALA